MVASYLQYIQETTALDRKQELQGEGSSETHHLLGNANPNSNYGSTQSGKKTKGSRNNSNSQQSKRSRPNDENTHALSKDLKTIAPFTSMVTPTERKWFKEFAPFMVGKARSITRVVNVYNLARYVAGQLLQTYKNDDTFKRKLMKVIILAEFWPYRTAFLMQVAEDLAQIQQIKSAHSTEDIDEDHGSLYDARCLLFDQDIKDIMEISLTRLYNKIVQRLLYSPKNQMDAKKMLSRDCDPQMFERLLSDVCTGGELKDRLKVKDFVVPSNLEHSSSCLCFLTLNMSRHMLEFTSRSLDDLILFVDDKSLGAGKKTLRFDYKTDHYKSGAIALMANPSYRTIQKKERQCDEDSTSSKGKGGDIEQKKAETIFLSIKNEKDTKKTLKRSIHNEETLDECFGDCRAKESSEVNIDDESFSWEDIKEFHVYDLPQLCGKRAKYHITFV